MNIFVILFLPTLLFLGSWQVIRGLEKQDIWERYSLNQSLTPINISNITKNFQEEFSYRTVYIKGQYSGDSMKLDNRVYRQIKGYEVFTPFESEGGRSYLVNRGWINKERNLKALPKNNTIQIEGIYTPFNRSGLSLKEKDNREGLVFQEISLKDVMDLYPELEIDNSLIQLNASSHGALEPAWSPSLFKAQRHWAYAAQWYGLFIVLLIGYIVYGNKRGKELG